MKREEQVEKILGGEGEVKEIRKEGKEILAKGKREKEREHI